MKWSLLMLLLILSGCVDRVVYFHDPIIDMSLEDRELAKKLSVIYPKEMKLKHRLVITAENKQYDLIGYLLYRQPDQYYAAAYVEAGAPIFEMVHKNGKGLVLRKPKYMPEIFLLNGIMQDLIHIYSNKGSKAVQMVGKDEEGTRFIIPHVNDYYHEYLVNKLGWLFSARTGHKGELKRTIRFKDHKEVGKHMFAQSIYIHNYETRYEMDVKLLEVETALPDNFDEKIGMLK